MTEDQSTYIGVSKRARTSGHTGIDFRLTSSRPRNGSGLTPAIQEPPAACRRLTCQGRAYAERRRWAGQFGRRIRGRLSALFCLVIAVLAIASLYPILVCAICFSDALYRYSRAHELGAGISARLPGSTRRCRLGSSALPLALSGLRDAWFFMAVGQLANLARPDLCRRDRA